MDDTKDRQSRNIKFLPNGDIIRASRENDYYTVMMMMHITIPYIVFGLLYVLL